MSRRLLFVLWIIGGLICIVLVTSIIKNNGFVPCQKCFDLFEIFQKSETDSSIPTRDSQVALSEIDVALGASSNPSPPTGFHSDVAEQERETQADGPTLKVKVKTTLAASRLVTKLLSDIQPRKQVCSYPQ